MKNTFTLFVFLFSASLIMGQDTQDFKGNRQKIKRDFKKKIERLNYNQSLDFDKTDRAMFERLDSMTWEYYDSFEQAWISDNRVEFEYNSRSLCEGLLNYIYDEDWILVDKQYIIYDEINRVERQIDSTLIEETLEWVQTVEFEFFYTSNNFIDSVIITYEDDGWLYFDKADLDYDAQGRLIEVIMAEKEIENMPWNVHSRDVYIYEDDLFQMEEQGQWFNGQDWEISSKREYIFSENWALQSSQYFYFNEQSQDWTSRWKSEFTYDEFGNLDQDISFNWNEGQNDWLSSYYSRFVYNNDYNKDELILPIFLESDYIYQEGLIDYFNHMLMTAESYLWNLDIEEYELTGKEHYYYSEQEIQGLDQLPKLESNIYPNPAKDFISIEMETQNNFLQVQILNLQGQIVLEESIQNHQAISISRLSCGIYSYHVVGEKSLTSGTFIKQ